MMGDQVDSSVSYPWYDWTETLRHARLIREMEVRQEREVELNRLGVSREIRADHELLRQGVSDEAWVALVKETLRSGSYQCGDRARFQRTGDD